MGDILALITIMLWPVIPLFWIPVHYKPKVFRKIGRLTYVMPLIEWLPLAYLLYTERDLLLSLKIEFLPVLNFAGLALLVMGTLLHIWTGKLLGLFGLVGLPEISSKAKGRLVTEGAFSVVRHPTYLAHALIFSGVFLVTGVAAVGIVTVLDLLIINTLIIPLEERELLGRFGEAYRKYKNSVPKLFPSLGKLRGLSK
jgi:protein-S-isoprenylcysteine O-methyltransferase Ste14